MNSSQLEKFIIEAINDNTNVKISQLVNISKGGIFYEDDEMSGNFADIVRNIFHGRLYHEPMNLETKNFFQRFVMCYKIIIKYNHKLLNNKTYIGQGGRNDFLNSFTLLMSGYGEFYYEKYKKIHDDYLEVAYQLFIFSKQFKGDFTDTIDVLSYSVIDNRKFQKEVFKVAFEDFGLNNYIDEYVNFRNLNFGDLLAEYEDFCHKLIYKNESLEMWFDEWYVVNKNEIEKILNSEWCRLIFKQNLSVIDKDLDKDLDNHCCNRYRICYHSNPLLDDISHIDINKISKEKLSVIMSTISIRNYDIVCTITKYLEHLFKNTNFEVINLLKDYSWFSPMITLLKTVPNDDKTFIALLKNKVIRKGIAKNSNIIFDTIRRRRTRVIRYLWSSEKKILLNLRNRDNQSVLEYAKTCRGLMQNIVKILSN